MRVRAACNAAVTAVAALGLLAGTIGPAAAAKAPTKAPTREEMQSAVEKAALAAYPTQPIGPPVCERRARPDANGAVSCLVGVGAVWLSVRVTPTTARDVRIESTVALVNKQAVVDLVQANATLPPSVDCGPEPLVVVVPGDQLLCSAKFRDGTSSLVVLTVRDVAGNAVIAGVL
jgi:hypothetical protein